MAQVTPAQCVFIDNAVRNLSVPREMGIDVIHFDDEVNDVGGLMDELRARRVVVDDVRRA